jgi:hypothetical protein
MEYAWATGGSANVGRRSWDEITRAFLKKFAAGVNIFLCGLIVMKHEDNCCFICAFLILWTLERTRLLLA